MAKLQDALTLLYSGGPTNEDPLLSLGGLASTAPGRSVYSQGFTASTIPGIELRFASRNPLGTGVLAFDQTNTRIVWTPSGGSTYSTAIKGTGLVSAGSDTLGYVQVWVDVSSLPGTDAQCNVDIATLYSEIFGNHPTSAQINGITEYRCLYLQNKGTYDIRRFSLSVGVAGAYSTLSLGSSLLPYSILSSGQEAVRGFTAINPFTGVPPYVQSSAESSSLQELGLMHMDGSPSYVPHISVDPLYSDGSSYNLPETIVDRTDSTSILSHVSWWPTLQWTILPANAFVWFWVRKVTAPFGASVETEAMSLDASMV